MIWYLKQLRIACLVVEKKKTYSPNGGFNGDLPRSKVKSHLKQIQV